MREHVERRYARGVWLKQELIVTIHRLIFRGETKKHFFGWSSRLTEPLPPPMAELVIRRVVGMSVQDDDGIGWADVHGITYDEGQRVVRLSSNVPVEVTCVVRALDVDLITT